MSSAPVTTPEAVPGVTVAESLALLDEGALLLDVREDTEWDAGHAPQAHHLALGTLTPELLPARDRLVVVVCRSGRRSRLAAASLIDAGVRAVNLDGGMQAWHAYGAPVVADHPSPSIA